MTPEELAQSLADLIADVEEQFSTAVLRIQDTLYRRLSVVLKDLKTDSEGYILQTAENRAILRQAEGVFDDVIRNSGYQAAVESVLGTIPDIDALNVAYFETIDKAFQPNRNFIKSLQRQVIRDVNTYALNDGLIVNVKVPLNQILNQNINAGASFTGMLEQLRNFITGGENQGRLLSYSRTFLSTTLFDYSRAYQQAVTKDLGLEFYLYSGGLTKPGKGSSGSRPFCIERADLFFHHKEIEDWAELDWSGKRQGTTKSSIFMFAGGWNCRHTIIPVSVVIVPQDVIERAIEKGYYKKAA